MRMVVVPMIAKQSKAKQSKAAFRFVLLLLRLRLGVGLFEPREHAIEIHLVHLLHHCHQVLLASQLLHHTRVHAALRMHTQRHTATRAQRVSQHSVIRHARHARHRQPASQPASLVAAWLERGWSVPVAAASSASDSASSAPAPNSRPCMR